jgi:RNA-directed DNA polymerase
MHERGKSDGPVVPAKPPNKAACVVAEVVEERGPAKGNTASSTHPGRSAGHGAPSGLERVREVARRDKEARFTALLHHVTVARLRAAYRAIRPQAAPGVDGVGWEAYGHDLEANLQDLHRRLHAGSYRARPSRRSYIPKAAAAAGHCHGGGQDPPAGRRRGAERRLRDGFPGLLLRVCVSRTGKGA